MANPLLHYFKKHKIPGMHIGFSDQYANYKTRLEFI